MRWRVEVKEVEKQGELGGGRDDSEDACIFGFGPAAR